MPEFVLYNSLVDLLRAPDAMAGRVRAIDVGKLLVREDVSRSTRDENSLLPLGTVVDQRVVRQTVADDKMSRVVAQHVMSVCAAAGYHVDMDRWTIYLETPEQREDFPQTICAIVAEQSLDNDKRIG